MLNRDPRSPRKNHCSKGIPMKYVMRSIVLAALLGLSGGVALAQDTGDKPLKRSAAVPIKTEAQSRPLPPPAAPEKPPCKDANSKAETDCKGQSGKGAANKN